jgi:putative spermidine/putrescine transport system permease protein
MSRRADFSDLSYRFVIGALATIALVILIGPVLIVLITSLTESRSMKFPPPGLSFQWYEQLFDERRSRQIHRAVSNSLEVAAWATGFATLFGWRSRGATRPGRAVWISSSCRR